MLQAEQVVALAQVAQFVMLQVAFYNTLLLLLPPVVVLVVVFVVVLVAGGVVVAGAAPGVKTIPLPGQAFLALGQIVLLQAIKVATAKAPQVESTNSAVKGSE